MSRGTDNPHSRVTIEPRERPRTTFDGAGIRQQPSHTPDMSPQALAFHSPQDRDPDMHTKNFLAACIRNLPCCDKGHFPEATELSTLPQEHVRFDAQFERQRSEKLRKITEILDEEIITVKNIERRATEISKIAEWAETNKTRLSEPSTGYDQVKSTFKDEEEKLYKHLGDEILSRLDTAAKLTEDRTERINQFNNAARPFLEQLCARLQPPQVGGRVLIIE